LGEIGQFSMANEKLEKFYVFPHNKNSAKGYVARNCYQSTYGA